MGQLKHLELSLSLQFHLADAFYPKLSPLPFFLNALWIRSALWFLRNRLQVFCSSSVGRVLFLVAFITHPQAPFPSTSTTCRSVPEATFLRLSTGGKLNSNPISSCKMFFVLLWWLVCHLLSFRFFFSPFCGYGFSGHEGHNWSQHCPYSSNRHKHTRCNFKKRQLTLHVYVQWRKANDKQTYKVSIATLVVILLW